MTDMGKEKYDSIPIPEDKLRYAIAAGMEKEQRERRRKRRRWLAGTVAAATLFVCANLPSVSVYAEEIPLLKLFVQAMRVGSGGEEMADVELEISGDEKNIDLAFRQGGTATEHALSYWVEEFVAPVRMELTFHGMDETAFPSLQERLLRLRGVADVYPTVPLEKEDLSFSVVLRKGYHYEVMEFSNPGALNISLYQDAYFTAEERHPQETVYFVRSAAVPYGRRLERLVERYRAEGLSQVKTAEGTYFITIGEYDRAAEATERLMALGRK